MKPERRFSCQQGALCGVAVQLGHPWRRLDQVVLEWGDVHVIVDLCKKYKSFSLITGTDKHITRVCDNFIYIKAVPASYASPANGRGGSGGTCRIGSGGGKT